MQKFRQFESRDVVMKPFSWLTSPNGVLSKLNMARIVAKNEQTPCH